MVTGSQDPTLVSKALTSLRGVPVAMEKPPKIHRVPEKKASVAKLETTPLEQKIIGSNPARV
jgi:hypothetical protein